MNSLKMLTNGNNFEILSVIYLKTLYKKEGRILINIS